jgi:hypothetical protein
VPEHGGVPEAAQAPAVMTFDGELDGPAQGTVDARKRVY